MKTRENTRKLIALAEAGEISWKDVAESALWWMSEVEVIKMTKANNLIAKKKEDK